MVRRERESLIANERYFQYERRKPEKIKKKTNVWEEKNHFSPIILLRKRTNKNSFKYERN